MFFFFNDTATTEIYTLSLHDALPISASSTTPSGCRDPVTSIRIVRRSRYTSTERSSPSSPRAIAWATRSIARSEEHTSELQSRQYLVCRLLLEKKKKYI